MKTNGNTIDEFVQRAKMPNVTRLIGFRKEWNVKTPEDKINFYEFLINSAEHSRLTNEAFLSYKTTENGELIGILNEAGEEYMNNKWGTPEFTKIPAYRLATLTKDNRNGERLDFTEGEDGEIETVIIKHPETSLLEQNIYESTPYRNIETRNTPETTLTGPRSGPDYKNNVDSFTIKPYNNK